MAKICVVIGNGCAKKNIVTVLKIIIDARTGSIDGAFLAVSYTHLDVYKRQILLFLYGTQTVLAAGGKRQRENLSVSGGEMSKVVLKENDANGTETRGVAENETEETETENGRTEMEGTEVDLSLIHI